MDEGPKTLLEAVQYFKNDAICIHYLAEKRWPDGKVMCPTCGGDRVHYLREHKRWQCSSRHPKRQFSIKGRHDYGRFPCRSGQMASGYVAGSQLPKRY